MKHSKVFEMHLWAADFQQVDCFPADVDVIGDVFEEHRHTVLRILRNQSVALRPKVLI